MKKACGLLLLLIVAGQMGCTGMARPRWFHPGNAESQRAQAQRFDPYPEQDIAPEDPGVRPHGFEQGYPEPERARWWERLGF